MSSFLWAISATVMPRGMSRTLPLFLILFIKNVNKNCYFCDILSLILSFPCVSGRGGAEAGVHARVGTPDLLVILQIPRGECDGNFTEEP